MKWQQFATWLFYGSLAFIGMTISKNIEKMQTGIQDLNTKVAVIISESNNTKTIITDHENRIRSLEQKNK